MNKKKIVTGIIICFILLITLIILNFLMKDEEQTQIGLSIEGRSVEGQLLLSGISVFSEKYIGFFETSEITQRMQEFVKKDIPELYENIKDYDEQGLKKYYNENNLEIENKFGLLNEDEFMSFANMIKETEIDFSIWYKLKVDKESFIVQSENANYAYVEFEVIFEDEQKMRYFAYIANGSITTPQYIFGILK